MAKQQDSKENFYFKSEEDGLWHFRCVFCNDTPVAGHSSEYEYWPDVCVHPEIKKLAGQGILCSNCFNWDFDMFKRRDSPVNRTPLRHKSGQLLTKGGWLHKQNNTMDSFLWIRFTNYLGSLPNKVHKLLRFSICIGSLGNLVLCIRWFTFIWGSLLI